jgi:electron transfer flavoprotein beta subunit
MSSDKHCWVVCIKQVPRDPVFKRVENYFKVDRDRTEGILNPADRDALDVARDLKAAAGGWIVAISMGPPQADEVLREALACGADRAVLLSDPCFAGADTLATALTLAAAVKKLGKVSLVLCGSRTLDSDTGQVGAQLAEMLDVPMASNVDRVSCRKNSLRVERRLDGLRESLEIPFPALIAVERQQKKPAATSLQAMEKAFDDLPVDRWTRKELGLDPAEVGWEGSATWARDFAYWKKKRSGEKLEGDVEEAADRILSILLERNTLGDM